MKSALFILPVATQPRFAKRIDSFLKNGVDVTVATFERDYFNLNTLPARVSIVRLGKIKSGNYLKRIPVLLKSLFKILKFSKDKDIVYIFSIDILLFTSMLLPKKKIYFEMGDLRKLENKLFSRLYHFLFRKILSRCSSIMVTSPAFSDYLTNKYSVSNNKIIIIENKLSKSFFSNNDNYIFKPIDKRFVVGIIGYLRYKNIIDFLDAYTRIANNNFNIVIYGDGNLKDRIMKYVDNKRIKYFGQFKYPDDIAKIYDSFDLSFVMYDSSDLNVKLALPNKMYESMFFKKPILVSSNTYLSEMINTYNIGFDWKQNNMYSLIEYLNSSQFIVFFNHLKYSFEVIEPESYLQ